MLNDDYSFNKDEYETEKHKMEEFLSIVKLFTKLDYDARVKYMRENWDDKKEEHAIYYGKYCKVIITYENDEKYHFIFDCENGDIELFNKIFPELSNKNQQEISEIYPQLQDIHYPETTESTDQSIDNLSNNYLEAYNNIKINKQN